MAISKINPIAMGIAFGALSGVAIFSAGLIIHLFLTDIPIAVGIGSLYITYKPSYLSSFICGSFSFIGTAIGGYILSKLYNILIDVV